MKIPRDLTGFVFGRLTVLSVDRKVNYKCFWKCLCACGAETIVSRGNLQSGHTLSCGCFMRERASEANKEHGDSKSREHKIWQGLIDRCLVKTNQAYQSYGGRGIKVCDRWMMYKNFLEDMGRAPSLKYTLDRRNNDGDYEPSNCRWATRKEQNNNRRDNVFIEYKGEKMTIAQWGNKLGIKDGAIRYRLKKWSIENAFTRPLYSHSKNYHKDEQVDFIHRVQSVSY